MPFSQAEGTIALEKILFSILSESFFPSVAAVLSHLKSSLTGRLPVHRSGLAAQVCQRTHA